MDIFHWHIFPRQELEDIAERAPGMLVDIILALQERLWRQEDRLDQLENRLKQDSRNSHQPPSS